MQERLNLEEVLGQADKFHANARRLFGKLDSPRQQKIIGELLDKFAAARTEAEQAVPAAFAAVDRIVERGKKCAAEMKATREQRKTDGEARVKAAREAAAQHAAAKQKIAAGTKRPLPDLKMPAGLPETLREELLDRFGRQASDMQPDASPRLRDIWEDWQWPSDDAPGA